MFRTSQGMVFVKLWVYPVRETLQNVINCPQAKNYITSKRNTQLSTNARVVFISTSFYLLLSFPGPSTIIGNKHCQYVIVSQFVWLFTSLLNRHVRNSATGLCTSDSHVFRSLAQWAALSLVLIKTYGESIRLDKFCSAAQRQVK